MHEEMKSRSVIKLIGWARQARPLVFTFLLIEFYDEASYAIGSAAMPSIRTDLGLSLAQVALLLGLGNLVMAFLEPVLMLLGDTPLRRRMVLMGGGATVLSAVLIGQAGSFPMLLAGWLLAHPASAAFVSLSQTTLMDLNTGRESKAMARWTVAGTLGNLLGPLVLAAVLSWSLGWRWVYPMLAAATLGMMAVLWAQPFPSHRTADGSIGLKFLLAEIHAGLREAARSRNLWRWIILLQTSNLMMDIFVSYLPLYLTGVAHLTPAQASLALSGYMLASLVADLALIPLLERFNGRMVVKVSAVLVSGLLIAFLLVSSPLSKVGLLLVLALARIGWYAVLSGERYAALPGRPSTVKALDSVGNLLEGGALWLVGSLASVSGLQVAMWLLLFGPLSLILFVPTNKINDASQGRRGSLTLERRE